MTWAITDEKKLDRNTLKGSFSLNIGPLKIEGWTYHVQGEKSWVNPPSKEYIDKESGEKKYWPIAHIEDKDRYWKFQNWAIEQVADRFAQQPKTAGQTAGTEDDGILF